MYFQKVLKGISSLSGATADDMVLRSGIRCNWWTRKHTITPEEIKDQLTDANVLFHLNHYDDPLPAKHPYATLPGATTYGDVTPYISTTAGVVERSLTLRTNIIFPSFMTALQFATQNFTTSGHIFYAYLITLGKKAIPLWQFSEEVRDLLVYQQFLPYYQEGEIVAKIHIPSSQIEKAELYHGPGVLQDLKNQKMPLPAHTITNTTYTPPDQYSNIRECI